MRLRFLTYLKAAQPIPKFITHMLAFMVGFGSIIHMEEKKRPFSFRGILISLPKRYSFKNGDVVYLQSKRKHCLISSDPYIINYVGNTMALLLPRNSSSKEVLKFVLSTDFSISSQVPKEKCLRQSSKVKYG